MTDPIVFISHFRFKKGKFEAFKPLTLDAAESVRSQKPRTLLYLSYVDEDHGTISFLHAFADADALDDHYAGAVERAKAAMEFLEPVGYEFYGSPSSAVIETMRQMATASGATLTVQPERLAGFIRLASG